MSSDEGLRHLCNELVTCAQAVCLAEQTLTAAGVDYPGFEAQLLAAYALKVDRTAVIARAAPDFQTSHKERLFQLLSERSRRVPLAFIRGSQEFYGLKFIVSSATLIPRPETELLVDFALEILTTNEYGMPPVLVDVGTGSGCVCIAAIKHCPGARAVAIDASRDALTIAGTNSVANSVSDRIRFVRSNLLDCVREPVRVIVSNPPYIASSKIDELQPEVSKHEPRMALDGGADGLVLIREIVQSARTTLEYGGWLALECGQGQAQILAELYANAGLTSVRIVNDLAGIQRMVCGMRPP